MADTKTGLFLCVDDEQIVLHSLRDQLYKHYGKNYLIEIAESAEEGLEILDELSLDGYAPVIVISDWLMPGMNGDEFFIQLHRKFPDVIKVMLSGQADAAAIQRARDEVDMFNMIDKPWDAQDLIHHIDQAIAQFNGVDPADEMKEDTALEIGILCVDDEPIVTESLRSLFYKSLKDVAVVEVAHSADEAMEVIDGFLDDGIELQVVISDYIMPGIKGDELLINIHNKLPKVKKIMLTGQSDIDGIRQAINQAELYRFLEKPWSNEDMILTIKSALTAYDQEARLENKNRELIQLNQALEAKVQERTRELEQKNRELERLATFDQLTGLVNRAKLDEVLRTELIRSNRYGNSLGLIMLDIDYFKAVNDTHGHQVGDKVLRLFAEQLRHGVRDADVPGRWGGEEFLIICPESDLHGVVTLAQSLRERVQKHEVEGVGKKTASFGVTVFEKKDTITAIIGRADKALYKAKENGRNRVECVMPGK
nr:diguanylate cyclase [uncultured Desulfobacter sp.]